MTNDTNRSEDEQSQKSFEAVQGATEDAFRAGQKYFSENPIPIIVGTLIVGAILVILLRPAPRKEPEPLEAVREWFEKAWEELLAKLPLSKKQLRSLKGEVADRAGGLQKRFCFWCH
jgi:hypothetical protein